MGLEPGIKQLKVPIYLTTKTLFFWQGIQAGARSELLGIFCINIYSSVTKEEADRRDWRGMEGEREQCVRSPHFCSIF